MPRRRTAAACSRQGFTRTSPSRSSRPTWRCWSRVSAGAASSRTNRRIRWSNTPPQGRRREVKLNSIELPPRAPGLSRTLVLLHGYGADERDLLPIAHELDPRLRAVSLQGSIALSGPMRAWFNLSQDAQGRISFDPDEARGAVQAAIGAVEEIGHGSPKPLLLGFSQGAGIALGVALLRPELVSGVLSLSGVARALEDRDHAPPDQLRTLRVFAA